MTALLLGILLVLLLLNARATYAIAQDKLSSRGQRISQFIFVWTTPFLGALLTLHIKKQQPERASRRYRKEPDPGDDFAYSGKSARQIRDRLENESSSSEGGASD